WLTLSPGLTTDAAAESALPGAPEFDLARVGPAEAIAAVRAHVAAAVRVTAVTLRRLPGHVAYQVTTENAGSYLVDAVTATVFRVDETLARRIVARFLRQDARAVESPPGANGGELTSHRIAIGDRKG